MLPLIRDLKTLQDVLNTALSDWQNNMQEDSRNSILVLKNYDGENLGEFRQNLATYGAVKIREDGDVKLLKVEINTGQYKEFIEFIKNYNSQSRPKVMELLDRYSHKDIFIFSTRAQAEEFLTKI